MDTGAVDIVRYNVVDDVGTVINLFCCTVKSTVGLRKARARFFWRISISTQRDSS